MNAVANNTANRQAAEQARARWEATPGFDKVRAVEQQLGRQLTIGQQMRILLGQRLA